MRYKHSIWYWTNHRVLITKHGKCHEIKVVDAMWMHSDGADLTWWSRKSRDIWVEICRIMLVLTNQKNGAMVARRNIPGWRDCMWQPLRWEAARVYWRNYGGSTGMEDESMASWDWRSKHSKILWGCIDHVKNSYFYLKGKILMFVNREAMWSNFQLN